MTFLEMDYVIVGSGSAGSVIANRLSENPKHQVLVLEYGGNDNSILIQMPAALSIPMQMKRYDWGFMTEPEPGLNGRKLHQARGKVIGGSSSINGMVYVRGHPSDYDQWVKMGAAGWSYSHCIPYFKRAENCGYGGDNYRGDIGPLRTSNGTGMRNPLYRAFINAGRQAGHPVTNDSNGYQQEGFGRMEMTVKEGRRWSTANAYLKPALQRPNLELKQHALVHRIVFEGKRAVGIEYTVNSKLFSVKARKEVILSAGPFNSPKILMLSGIGRPERIKKVGIEVLHNLPGVGENLHDHLEVWLQSKCLEPISLNAYTGKISKTLIALRWLLLKNGLGATNHFEASGYIKSQPKLLAPDIQYHFLPGAISYKGKNSTQGHGFQIHLGPNKPLSRGYVKLRSAKPETPPQIFFNYLQQEEDRKAFRDGIHLTREILSQPALSNYHGFEISPGSEVITDEEIDNWVAGNAETAYHPCGSCRMGKDHQSVVDKVGKVHGLNSLRVVDSSIIPFITNGNLNAPTIMIAEKICDSILNKSPLPRANLPLFWEENK